MKNNPDDVRDKRLDNPQTFKKKDPTVPDTLETTVVHFFKKIFNDKIHKHENKWVRRKVGIRRAAIIRDMKRSVQEIANELQMSAAEVWSLREMFCETERRTEPVKEKSDFEKYQDDVYGAYEDVRLGENSPTLYQTRLTPSNTDPRILVTEKVRIQEFGQNYR